MICSLFAFFSVRTCAYITKNCNQSGQDVRKQKTLTEFDYMLDGKDKQMINKKIIV